MRLKNIYGVIFKLLLCFGIQSIAIAQTDLACPPAPMPAEQAMDYIAKTPAKNAGFLWRIEREGRTSWLYGTMHLMHIDYAKPGMQIMMGVRNSDLLVVEVNIYEPQMPAQTLPTTPSFSLSGLQLDRLRSAYKKDCISGEPTQLLIGALTIAQAQRKNLYWGYGPDARLMQIAKRMNKPIVSLETASQQAEALRPRTKEEFDEQVDASLKAFESGQMQENLGNTAQAWQQNDLPFFIKSEQDMTTNQPTFALRINDQRNTLMAQKIDALLIEGKRIFVAVGALHMTGKFGLPKLLQDKGYSVQFVPLKN